MIIFVIQLGRGKRKRRPSKHLLVDLKPTWHRHNIPKKIIMQELKACMATATKNPDGRQSQGFILITGRTSLVVFGGAFLTCNAAHTSSSCPGSVRAAAT